MLRAIGLALTDLGDRRILAIMVQALGIALLVFAIIGALQILNLWLGLYSAPGEWPWTYFFLFLLQVMLAIHCYGRSLGLDALLHAGRDSRNRTGWIGRLLVAAS